MLKQYDTFNIIYEKKCDDESCNKERIAITFHIVGYNQSKINNNGKCGNIYNVINKMVDVMKKKGDFAYSNTEDFIQMIINEAWRYHIHLEYDIPTFGTFELN